MSKDVIVDFWEWYQNRKTRYYNPVAEHALDKCEEMLKQRQWESFGYWHRIYLRERRKSVNWYRRSHEMEQKLKKTTLTISIARRERENDVLVRAHNISYQRAFDQNGRGGSAFISSTALCGRRKPSVPALALSRRSARRQAMARNSIPCHGRSSAQ